MKKLFFYFVLLAFSTSTIVAQSNWSFGVSLTGIGNRSDYVAGMSDANALFNHDKYGNVSLGFVSRYFINNHWSVQSGLKFGQIGFEYSLAKDYSFFKKDDHFTKNNLGIPVVQIPLTVIYAFNPNCKNYRWFIGAGVSIMNNFNVINKTVNAIPKGADNATNQVYLNQTVTAHTFTTINGQLMGGIEKLLKKGGIIQFGVIANRGFSDIATSTVSYSVDSKTYYHTFKNKGNYAGVVISYYFKPHKKK